MIDWQKYKSYREVTAYPEHFNDRRFEIKELCEATKKSDILYRGWPFIYFDNNLKDTNVIKDAIETIIDLSDIRGYEQFETWKIKRSGLFFHRALMDEETSPRAKNLGKVLDFDLTIWHISEAIGSLWHLYDALNVPDKEYITFNFTYTDVDNRKLVVLNPERVGFMMEQICYSPSISIERRLPLGEWRASDVDISTEISSEFFQNFQVIEPNLPAIKKLVSKILAKQ